MSDKTTREQIVDAADRLFYRQGFDHTSFSDIAAAVRISRGNFYYHFKTKDEILDAVIDLRLSHTRQMLKRWEEEGKTPAERIRCFIHILIANKADIKRYGCPLGTLSSELAKLNHAAQGEAKALFTLFRGWLRRQFEALGHKADADALAMHILARSQGVATLANAYQEEKFIRKEVALMCDWLDACIAEGGRPRRPSARDRRPHQVFIVQLKFAGNKARAGEFMEGHKAWLKRGFDDGVFLLAGSLPPDLGGGIVAHNTSRDDLEDRVSDDPFVAEQVVSAEILEMTPSRADERLNFLLES